MIKPDVKFINTVIFFFAILFMITGCVSGTGSNTSSGSKEVWKGRMEGDIRGNMTVILKPTPKQNQVRDIFGDITIHYDYAKGGHDAGVMRGRIKGLLTNGQLSASISGSVIQATFMGDLQGPMSGTEGSGSWSIYVPDEAAGNFDGTWQFEKQ